MSKKIVIACGFGAVSSKTLVVKIENFLREKGIAATIENCRLHELEAKTYMNNYDLLITTSPISNTFGVPHITATALLTGVGAEKVYEQILDILTD
jgi:PTS system galactitol-specific IIB component